MHTVRDTSSQGAVRGAAGEVVWLIVVAPCQIAVEVSGVVDEQRIVVSQPLDSNPPSHNVTRAGGRSRGAEHAAETSRRID